jgi:hypothetical protein
MKRILDLVFTTLAFFVFGFSIFACVANNISPDQDLSLTWYLLIVITLSVGFIFWRFWSAESKKVVPENKVLIGIGGWLILLLIGVGISVINSFALLKESQNIWFIITAVLNIATLILFIGKFRLAILFLLLLLLNNLLLTLVAGAMPDILRDTTSLLVWGLYVLKSVRVKQTFIKSLWSR